MNFELIIGCGYSMEYLQEKFTELLGSWFRQKLGFTFLQNFDKHSNQFW